MERFSSDGVEIAYLDQGEGHPVLLVHGFASSARVNWVEPGWVDLLSRTGHRVISLDNRGHGRSKKFYDPEDYGPALMAGDACRLLDHLKIEKADVLGYSMGSWVVFFLALYYPRRVRRMVLGGVGSNFLEGSQHMDEIVSGLESHDPALIPTPYGRAFRAFADANKNDLKALAMCARSGYPPVKREDLMSLRVPVMVAVGTEDELAGPVAPLVESFFSAERLDVPNRDHMRTVGDKIFKQGVVNFLNLP
ncbi:MAG: alpha/beta hydrolase [Alphaproteobacteria bacterium]|nr:alpha/beta hydrolase [Alphaproteobacteria bacterium]